MESAYESKELDIRAKMEAENRILQKLDKLQDRILVLRAYPPPVLQPGAVLNWAREEDDLLVRYMKECFALKDLGSMDRFHRRFHFAES